MSTNRLSVLATVLFVLLVALPSCSNHHKTGQDDYFYPVNDYDYFHVSYLNDTIVITGESSTYHFQKKWLLTKEAGEYYLEDGSYKKLFMSNSIYYSDSVYDERPQKKSVLIKKADGDLITSTLCANVTETQRNPLISITYDKDYNIKNIKYVFVDYKKAGSVEK